MAKVKHTFSANISLNQNKGGAWLASYSLSSASSIISQGETTAWKNASAAKRWIKERVVAKTPRKSLKWTHVVQNADSKPVEFSGVLEYNA